MRKISRRTFLQATGLLAASAALTACGSSSSDSGSTTTAAETEAGTAAETTAAAVEEQEITVDTARPSTADSEGRADKIVIALNADPTELAPHSPNNQNKGYIIDLIFEQMFVYYDNTYWPVIAEGYEEVDDLHWACTIKDNIYDSEGNHITADDVVFSVKWLVDSGYTNQFSNYVDIEKTGDYEVTFTWDTPVDAISEVQNPLASKIFSQAAYEAHNFSVDPVGSGPYKLADFVSGTSITLEARDDYWAAGEEVNYMQYAKAQTIEYQIITEASQNVTGLTTGLLDISSNIPDDSIEDFQEGGMYADEFGLSLRNGTDVCWVVWNMTEGKITADENFRLACCYALDNEVIAALAGTYSPLTAFCSPSCGDWDDSYVVEDGYITTQDVELAKEYLSMTDYNGETLSVMCYNTEAYKNIATAIVAELAAIGINSEVKSLSNNDWDADMGDPDAWDISSGYIGGATLPTGLNRILNYGDFSADSGAGFIQDAKLLDLWEATRNVNTYGPESIKECLDYMYDNVYFYPTVTSYTAIVTSDKVASLYFDPGTPSKIWPNNCEYYLD